jgi:hypothetical protein
VHHGPLDDGVRAREPDPLPLETELREDEVRRRRPDVDPDRAQTQTLRRDIADVVRVVVVAVALVRVRRVLGDQTRTGNSSIFTATPLRSQRST